MTDQPVPHKKINWRSRIVESGKIRAVDVCPHPQNPRRHPQAQREAVAASFDELGQIGRIIINRNNGYLVDGEERAWLALDQGDDTELDVDWVDLTEEEHLKALAYYDATGGLAQYDKERFAFILDEIQSPNSAIQQMLNQMAEDQGITPPNFDPVDISEQPRLDQKSPIICPHCGEEFIPS